MVVMVVVDHAKCTFRGTLSFWVLTGIIRSDGHHDVVTWRVQQTTTFAYPPPNFPSVCRIRVNIHCRNACSDSRINQSIFVLSFLKLWQLIKLFIITINHQLALFQGWIVIIRRIMFVTEQKWVPTSLSCYYLRILWYV